MCRHLAYLGPPVPLGAVLLDPPHGLMRQSWAPRRQRYGTVNADGFGIGWYVDGDPVPARYRRDRPMWTDAFVADLARTVRSRAIVAAVRSGTEGMQYGEGAAAPFAADQYLFSHNGVIPGWPASAGALAADLPADELLTLDSATDSALLWALVRHRLRSGSALAAALAEVVVLAAGTGARLNLLASDGRSVAATAWGDTLWWRADGRGVLIASEPSDDDEGWREVPDHSLVTATPDGVAVAPLELSIPERTE